MKIKSLLAAVSMVALTAGTASALSIPQTPAMGAVPANVMVPEGAVLASELMLPADGIGSVTFSIVTDSGDYPSGNNFIINIALPTGVAIDGPISGSVLVGTSQGAGTGSAVVQSQTATGVQLFVSIPQAGTPINRIDFDLPLELTSCAVSGTLDITVNTEGGTPVEDGAASAVSPIAPCESAFDTTFVADANDTVIGLTDYEQLKDVPGGGLTNSSIIGLYSAEIDTTVGLDLAGTPMTAASIDEVTANVVFADGSEIAGVTIDGVAGTASTDGNTYSFVLPFGADVVDADIIVTVEGDDPIVSQAVVANSVLHDLTDAEADLIGSESGVGGALDTLQREGQSFGVFDWNSGQAGAQRLNVYRITGLDADSTVPYTVSIENAGLTGAANTVTGSVTANGAGEAVLTDSMIAAMLPATVSRFDFGINLETGNDVDIDRLMSTGGIVTSFNDGANNTLFSTTNQPTGDSDNFSGSE